MLTKIKLTRFVQERLGDIASPIFMKRVLTVIEESPEDKGSLASAVDKVSKMVELFIDKKLARELSESLMDKVHKN